MLISYLCALLILPISSLHFSHLVAQQDVLITNQTLLQSSIATLLQNIQHHTDDPNNPDLTARAISLETSVLLQRQMLAALYPLTTLSLNAPWVCAPIPNSAALLSDINTVVTDSAQIIRILTATSPITPSALPSTIPVSLQNSTLQLTSQAQNAQNLLQSVGKEVPQGTAFSMRNNLAGQNWILPPSGITSLNAAYITNSNSMTCPIETPYIGKSGKCISCPNEQYSFTSQSCVSCSDFNAVTHSCNSLAASQGLQFTNWIVQSPKTILATGQLLPPQINSPFACPSSQPFFNGSQCVLCKDQVNLTSLQCASCAEGTTYDVQSHGCLTPSEAAMVGAILPEGMTLAQYKNTASLMGTVCPSKQFFNGNICVLCENGMQFSLASKACVTCPTGYQYNSITLSCLANQYYSNLNNPNWEASNATLIQQKILASSQQANGILCDISTPFFDGKNCMTCPKPQIFSADLLACVSCPSGTVLSPNIHTCMTPANKLTNPATAPNLILSGMSINQFTTEYNNALNSSLTVSACPTSTPYFNGVACINCPATNRYFNVETKMCTNCPANTIYDANVMDCITSSGNIATQYPSIEKMTVGILT